MAKHFGALDHGEIIKKKIVIKHYKWDFLFQESESKEGFIFSFIF
jgi:hypothetical protein